MTVRKLRAKQRGPSCFWCAKRAAFRGFMFGRFACLTHLDDLLAWDRLASAPDYSDATFTRGEPA